MGDVDKAEWVHPGRPQGGAGVRSEEPAETAMVEHFQREVLVASVFNPTIRTSPCLRPLTSGNH